MKAVLQEVHSELLSGRLLEPEYHGVVLAHKDDHAGLFRLISTTLNGKLCVNQGKFIANSGAVLRVIDDGSDDFIPDNKLHYNHAGLIYTTIILSGAMLMSKEDCKPRVNSTSEFIMYMASRLRTQSGLHTRMVIC